MAPLSEDPRHAIAERAPRWLVAVGVLAVLLFTAAAVYWSLEGGVEGIGASGEWVAALGSEDGTSQIVLLVVGEATLVAALLYILLIAAEGDPSDRYLVRVSTAGALLLAVEGAMLASIGWVASPFIAEAEMTPNNPFVKAVELVMVVRTHVSVGGGSLIGVGVAWSAFRSLRRGDIPKGMVVSGAAAGIVALVGGAILLLGFGAAIHTVGVIGSIAWTGTRSGFLTFRAARDAAD